MPSSDIVKKIEITEINTNRKITRQKRIQDRLHYIRRTKDSKEKRKGAEPGNHRYVLRVQGGVYL